jgi:hypothetical protein
LLVKAESKTSLARLFFNNVRKGLSELRWTRIPPIICGMGINGSYFRGYQAFPSLSWKTVQLVAFRFKVGKL